MQALAAGPAAAPPRQLVVGAALASVAMVMLAGGMLAVWSLQRRRSVDLDGTWVPAGVTIPVVVNTDPPNRIAVGSQPFEAVRNAFEIRSAHA